MKEEILFNNITAYYINVLLNIILQNLHFSKDYINSVYIKLGKVMAHPGKWLGRILVQSRMHILASSTKSGNSMLASFC